MPTLADRIAALYNSLIREDQERFTEELAVTPNPSGVVADWEQRDLRSANA